MATVNNYYGDLPQQPSLSAPPIAVDPQWIFADVARQLAQGMLAKSGVREWEDTEVREKISLAAIEMAAVITGYQLMATQYFKTTLGTPKVIRKVGGDAEFTWTGLATGNGTSTGARQAVTIDLGENWARLHKIESSLTFQATPTANSGVVNFFGAFGAATGAGKGNTSGTDAAYTGYANNITNATRNHMKRLGQHTCTADATPTVQSAHCGIFMPLGRYLNFVAENLGGVALTADETHFVTITPIEELSQDTV